MFTNWLTGTTGSSSSSSGGTNRSLEATSHNANGLTLVGVTGLTNLNSNLISTSPDVILEVGPGPTTMRFMAHSIVLGMHSGYLRSAIRLDDHATPHSQPHHHTSHESDFMVYLSNVTPDQFAPLLSYMYTGYLDLNVENIFSVLLATHVLHMPRALEICRSYLARAQAEGYFGTNSGSLSSNAHSSHQSSSKIIRPIASKPHLPNFGFLPLTSTFQAPQSTSPLVNRSTTTITNVAMPKINETDSNNDEEVDIDVDELDKLSTTPNERISLTLGEFASTQHNDDDDEDIEVFIDTTSEDAEVVTEVSETKIPLKKSHSDSNYKNNRNKDSVMATPPNNKSRHEKTHKKSNKSDRRRKSGPSSSGLQVAKAPIPASQLDTSDANKVIIDVASCDGPVRFKRILNTAYGHKPDPCSMTASCQTASGSISGPERSPQSVSLSFHQQMAKTISQQQQKQQMHHGEESENSETSNGSIGALGSNNNGVSGSSIGGNKVGRKVQNEIFVCVYCKHTFKSQYCYQKHAKRHLNPLTLQATCISSGEKQTTSSDVAIHLSSPVSDQTTVIKGPNLQNIRPFAVRNTTSTSGHQPLSQVCSTLTAPSTTDFLRREVRPLDMNVQYYPCKTCGCKFPSYYFVHKHRKMCHADEEASSQQSNSVINSASLSSAPTTPANNVNDNEIPEEDDMMGNARNLV
ncbi:uncharacterized protein LOC142231696 [Haematobia irritans]|uniref:uncharacterized protein LOC142231696 n=1 Tax=Haematobia irritans TaxID=7368 RepID=UPI003F4FFB93